jgi:type IV pilus assembly protein PilN
MIRINLASNTAKAKAITGGSESIDSTLTIGNDSEVQKQGALRLLVILLFPAGLYVYELQAIPNKQAQLAGRQALLSELQQKNQKALGAVSEIKRFKADQARIQSQITVLENLKKGRLQEVKVLDSIQRNIPGKVWLQRIDIAGGKITMQGLAATDNGLTSFMDVLSRSIFLKDVALIKSERVDINGGDSLKKFDITCFLEKVQ